MTCSCHRYGLTFADEQKLTCDLHAKKRRHKQMFWTSYEIRRPIPTSQPKVSSVQGKILPHLKLKKQSHENIGTPPHLELCWKMEKRLNSTQTIQGLFPQRVAWSHLKPSDFKIVFNDLISHKPPLAWIMIISQQRFGEK